MTDTIKYGELFKHDYKFFEYTKADLEAAVTAEREACAKVCDESAPDYEEGKNMAVVCAAAIRARGDHG